MSIQNRRRLDARLNLVALVACWLGIAGAAHAEICRVAADGVESANGSNWTSAAMTLRAALDSSRCSEVWVKAGVYRPGDAVDDSFAIRPGVAVYGGFAGGESHRQQRDPAINASVLSGDIDQNDVGGGSDAIDASWDQIRGNNSVHVVLMDGTAATGKVLVDTVLDGFTITGGYAVGVGIAGGGLLCMGQGSGHACSPTLSNLVFAANYGSAGGGAAFKGVDGGTVRPMLDNVTFRRNGSSLGGGMFTDGSNGGVAEPVLSKVTFSGNDSSMLGGAMASVSVQGTSNPVLTNVTFSNNLAIAGAGMSIDGSEGNASPQLRNVTFAGNTSIANVGTIYIKGSSDGRTQLSVGNTILFDAAGPELYIDGAEAYIGYSIVAGGCPLAFSLCYAVDDSDPQLASLADNGGTTQTLLPASTSPAIDAGYLTNCAGTDQRGIDRPQGGGCDIGAVEVLPDRIFAGNFDP